MAKIVYQTDKWGRKDGAHYIEFEVNGVALQILVTNDVVNVISPARFGDKETSACNSVYVLPKGSKFNTVHEYHVDRDKAKCDRYAEDSCVFPEIEGCGGDAVFDRMVL